MEEAKQIATNFVTYKELIFIVLASSGLLTLLFTIISRLFDKGSRVIIMDEIRKIDDKYQEKVNELASKVADEITEIKGEVDEFRMNYVSRFIEQKDLIVANKEIASDNHSAVMQVLAEIRGDIKHLHNNNNK